MSQIEDTIDDGAATEQFAEELANWNSSFDPFVTADGYDYATYMLHFNELFNGDGTVPGATMSNEAFIAPGASVTFSIH